MTPAVEAAKSAGIAFDLHEYSGVEVGDGDYATAVAAALGRPPAQLYKTLDQNIPDGEKTDEVWDLIGFFRTILERTDTSLLEEWESLVDPSLRGARKQVHEIVEAKWLRDLATDSRILSARLRTEMKA